MKLDPEEQKKGLTWLLIAGPVAIFLTFALYTADQTLTQSTGEAELGKTLRELRGAQTSLSAGAVDPRQLRTVSSASDQEPVNESAHSEHGDH